MILSAQFANPEGTAVTVVTDNHGAMSISAERPVLWAEYQAWNGTTAPYAPPDLSAIDQDTLNRALTEEGGVVRALAEVVFSEINKLRVKTGDVAYTKPQFVAALKAKMRT